MNRKEFLQDYSSRRRPDVPAYVKDAVKVRVWRAWAEANLGEDTNEGWPSFIFPRFIV
jgi:hypothetical protein